MPGPACGHVPAYAFEPGLEPDVSTLALMLEEDAVEAVELPENEKTVLTADPADAETYQWADPGDGIPGAVGGYLWPDRGGV